MPRNFRFPLSLALSALLYAGCYYDNEEYLYGAGGGLNCDSVTVSFAADIVPILDGAGCIGCHNNGIQSGNISLEGHANVALYAGNLNGRLWGAVNHERNFSAMPQGGAKLPASQLDKIRCWIEKGALNN